MAERTRSEAAMRSIVPVAALGLLAAFTLLAPGIDARPSPACTDAAGGSCPGIVCVDQNLDGTFQYDECVIMYCPEYGCCSATCPPPPYE